MNIAGNLLIPVVRLSAAADTDYLQAAVPPSAGEHVLTITE